MKNKVFRKRGVNLIALICLIAVMAIILGTVVLSFNNIYITTKKKEFYNEIYTIQKMVEEYKFKYGKYPTKSDDSEELDLYELGVNETNRGRKTNDENDVYTIDKETGKVKYKKGANIGGKTYSTLDEINNDLNLNKK